MSKKICVPRRIFALAAAARKPPDVKSGTLHAGLDLSREEARPRRCAMLPRWE
jgi:hypothetical protein